MIDRIKQIVAQMMSQQGTQRVGTVYDYDQSNYSVRVQLQPSGEITGWIPIGVEWVGNGYGMAIGPNIGDLVRIDSIEGSKQVAVMGKRFYTDSTLPMQVPSGECWIRHAGGSSFKFTNDNKLSINGQLEIDATAPTINITSTVAVNVVAPAINMGASGQTLSALVTSAMQTLFNSHTHNDPQGGVTGVPNQTMGAGQITTTIKGG